MKFFKFWLPLLIWLGFIFYVSSLQAEAFPVQLLDTVSSYFGHFFEYIILGLLVFRAFDNSFADGFKNFIYSLSFGGFYALTDELHQSFVPSRFFSIWDILVDILGVSFALFLIFFWKKRKSCS